MTDISAVQMIKALEPCAWLSSTHILTPKVAARLATGKLSPSCVHATSKPLIAAGRYQD